ncbi:flagellin lysine-N-methylase [Clostridium gasigenes]|uniref:flagellin lysine-N-methylase n=1 Tax=Clostridium gasigenes TaxID=94869 RepID=UPI001C0E335E|nr:flagellin lysine-N-methylase [Clostridium gasigenes]MBU3109455.1 flagellin lysine-N-methylase [Clostridium gasigenes]
MNKMLVPEFFLKFKCIGSLCENTCCGGWNIMIDKKTYKNYKKIRGKEFKKLMNNAVEINPNAKCDSQFAKIKLNNKGECEFLDDNKLCIIHKELGENGLCYTCKTYPRSYNKVGNLAEISLSMSCPEVARIALLNPNKMSFENMEIKSNFKYYPTTIINENEELFWMVRIFTIDLIQNRNFKIWQRLLILGLFFEKTEDFIKNHEQDEILSVINSFKYLLENDSIEELLNDFEVNSNFQLDIIKLLNDTRLISDRHFKQNTIDKFLKECIKSFNEGLQIETLQIEGLQIESDITEKQYEIYKNNYTNYYAKYMDDHEYILENYFTNYIFTNIFPFQYENRDSFDEYCIMVLNYALIKTYLIGISGEHKYIDDDIVIKLINSIERTYHHGNKAIEYIFEKLKQSNKINIKNMSLLLKN